MPGPHHAPHLTPRSPLTCQALTQGVLLAICYLPYLAGRAARHLPPSLFGRACYSPSVTFLIWQGVLLAVCYGSTIGGFATTIGTPVNSVIMGQEILNGDGVHAYMHVHMHMCMCMCACVCAFACVCVCLCVCACACVCQ